MSSLPSFSRFGVVMAWEQSDEVNSVELLPEWASQVTMGTETVAVVLVSADVEQAQQLAASVFQEDSKVNNSVRHTPDHAPDNMDPTDYRCGHHDDIIRHVQQELQKHPEKRKQFEVWEKEIADKFGWGEVLTEEKKQKLKLLLYSFKKVFEGNPKAPREIKGVEVALYLNSETAIPHVRPIPKLSKEEWETCSKDTQTMLRNGIIRLSDSAWATVPVFARKADGTLRYAIDYRGLNQYLVATNYPLPNIEEVLQSLLEAEVYSQLDLSSGFWGLSIREKDRHLTGFRAVCDGAWGLYEFCRQPFGLKTASAWFQMECRR
jgi:hypothetical protein